MTSKNKQKPVGSSNLNLIFHSINYIKYHFSTRPRCSKAWWKWNGDVVLRQETISVIQLMVKGRVHPEHLLKFNIDT